MFPSWGTQEAPSRRPVAAVDLAPRRFVDKSKLVRRRSVRKRPGERVSARGDRARRGREAYRRSEFESARLVGRTGKPVPTRSAAAPGCGDDKWSAAA